MCTLQSIKEQLPCRWRPVIRRYSLMFQAGAFCRVTTHDLRTDDDFIWRPRPVEAPAAWRAVDFRASMERDETLCRKAGTVQRRTASNWPQCRLPRDW